MDESRLELLSAYHDRELSPGETARLRQSLTGDDDARAILDAFDDVDDAVRASFASELDDPVPLALARTVRAGLAARRRRAVTRSVMRWAGPMAAAIALVIGGNQWIEHRIEGALAEREAQIAALTNDAVQTALETALSGNAVQLADAKLSGTVSITPIRTYRSETEHWCREFVEEVVIEGEKVTRFGLACREADGEWRRVQTRLPGSTPPPVGQPAGQAL